MRSVYIMKAVCVLIAVSLHVAVLAAGEFLGGSTLKVRTNVPVYNIDLVRLAPAKTKKGPVKKTPPKKEAKKEPPKKEPPKPDVKSVPVKKTAPPKEPKAQKQVALKTQNATTPKPPPVKTKKKAPKKAAPKKKAPPKPTPEQIKAAALEQAVKDAKWKEHLERKRLQKELESLRSEVEQADANATEAGQGGTGDSYEPGRAELYGRLVEISVKSNWRFPVLPTKTVLTAVVEIGITPDGKIVEYKLVRSSGRMDFDASVQRAVTDTDTLPLPPPGVKRIRITFNNEELG